jgi:hypothetical protein
MVKESGLNTSKCFQNLIAFNFIICVIIVYCHFQIIELSYIFVHFQ